MTAAGSAAGGHAVGITQQSVALLKRALAAPPAVSPRLLAKPTLVKNGMRWSARVLAELAYVEHLLI